MNIYESENFIILTPEQPHISRTDGGHLVIAPKVAVKDRTELLPSLAVELMKLTMVAGEAMMEVLNRKGILVGRINYQDNGNWKEQLHIHLYGRAKGAIIQKYGTPLQFPLTLAEFKEKMGNLEPLISEDVEEIRSAILNRLALEKYQSF